MEYKLIIKKIEKTLSKEEAQLFESWINESKEHQNYFDRIYKQYNTPSPKVDTKKGWNIVAAKLNLKKAPFNYYKVGYAVAIIVIFLNIFISDRHQFFNDQLPLTKNTIKTNINKAILTSETGAEYILEKGKKVITKNAISDGEKLIYSTEEKFVEEEAYNYLKVPRGGGLFSVELADGTQVWLNSESQLKYPVRFSKNKPRKVELLYGEAYFDVSPSELHQGVSFVLIAKEQQVEVLGTQFNVKAYKDENHIYTTLIEGLVDVSANGISNKIIPKQQAIFNQKERFFEIITVDVSNYISWKKGVYNFNKVTLKEIMNVIARWYDYDVVFENQNIEKIKFIGSLNRKQSIEDILNNIKATETITNYRISNGTIILN